MKVALSNTNFPFVSTQFNTDTERTLAIIYGRPARGQFFLSCVFLFFVVAVFFSYLTCLLFLRLLTWAVTAMKSFFFQFFTSWIILITQ